MMCHFKKCAIGTEKVSESENCKKNHSLFFALKSTFKIIEFQKVFFCNYLLINELSLIFTLFYFFSTYNNNNNNIYIYKRI
jgi:hypothetical protein